MTRPAPGAAAMATLLEALGAEPVVAPLIRTAPPQDPEPLRRAAAQLPEYDWIVFTSPRSVRALAAVVMDADDPRRARVAAVGSVTAAAVAEVLGWTVAAVPEHFAGAAVLDAMTAVAPVHGTRVLWPRAADARPDVRHDLTAAGAHVDDPEAYRTEEVPESAAQLRRLCAGGQLDALTFTAPSAVHAFARAGGRPGAAVVAVIGPSTAAAARACGLPVHVEPAEHTIPALIAELARHMTPAEPG